MPVIEDYDAIENHPLLLVPGPASHEQDELSIEDSGSPADHLEVIVVELTQAEGSDGDTLLPTNPAQAKPQEQPKHGKKNQSLVIEDIGGVMSSSSSRQRQDVLLLAAVESGNFEDVLRCLNVGDGPRMGCDANPLTCAASAISSGRADILQILLEHYFLGKQAPLVQQAANSSSKRERKEKSLLHLAVIKKQTDCLKVLLQSGQVSCVDNNGDSPLSAAVKAGWMDGVRLFLSETVDFGKKFGRSPQKTVLELAVGLDNYDVFAEVLAKVTLSETSSEIINSTFQGETPLFFAVRKGKLKFVKALLRAGANVKAPGKDGCSLLHCAAKGYNVKVIQALFEQKPTEMRDYLNKNCSGDFQGTPLHLAIYNGMVVNVQFLIKKLTNEVSGQAIHVVEMENNGSNSLLKRKQQEKEQDFGKANINCRKEKEVIKGCNLIHIASASISNTQEIRNYFINVLLKKDKRQNQMQSLLWQVNDAGETPLQFALKRHQSEFVQELIFLGSDLSAMCKDINGQPRTTVDILIHSTPGAVTMLTSLLNKSISKTKHGQEVVVDYKVLLSKADTDHGFDVLNSLRETGDLLGQKKILEHPLVESYLHDHWRRLQGAYWTLIILNTLFAIVLSILVLIKRWNTTHDTAVTLVVVWWLLVALVLFLTSILVVNEVQWIESFKQGTYRLETLMRILCFGLSVSVCFPETPPECSAFAILLAVFEWVIMMSRIPDTGYFMMLFIEVGLKYTKLFVSFVFVIYGFIVAFMVMFRFTPPFNSLLSSIMKTIVMMANEYDYDNLRNATMSSDLHLSLMSQISAMIIFILFIILVGLVLTNIFVAVGVNHVEKMHIIGKRVDFLRNYQKLLLYPPKWWPFHCGIMMLLYRAFCKVWPKGNLLPDCLARIERLKSISIDKKCGSSRQEILNSALIFKGFQDRERLTKIYDDNQAKLKKEKETKELKRQKEEDEKKQREILMKELEKLNLAISRLLQEHPDSLV